MAVNVFGQQVLDLNKGVGQWQAKSKAASESEEIDLQLTSSALNKTNHMVAGVDREFALQILNIAKEEEEDKKLVEEEEDKKLLEEVDREVIDSNLATMMMINEW